MMDPNPASLVHYSTGTSAGTMQKCSSTLSALFTPFYPSAQQSQQNSEVDGYGSAYGGSGTCATALGANFYNFRAYTSEPYDGTWAREGFYWGNAWQWCAPSGNYQYGAYLPSISSTEAPQEEHVSPFDVTIFHDLTSHGEDFIGETSGEYRSSLCENGQLHYDHIEKMYADALAFPMEFYNQSDTLQNKENAVVEVSTVSPVSVPQIAIPGMVQNMDDLSLALGLPIAKEETVFLKSQEASVNSSKASLNDCSAEDQQDNRMEHEDVPCESRSESDAHLRPAVLLHRDNEDTTAACVNKSKDFSHMVAEEEAHLSIHSEVFKSEAMSGNQLLISSIYNLSTVLARNASGDFIYALQQSIYLLSQYLLQLSSNVALACTEGVQELESLQALGLQKPLFKDKPSGCKCSATCGVLMDSVLQDLSKLFCKKEDSPAGAIVHGVNMKTPSHDKHSAENDVDNVQTLSLSEGVKKELADLQAQVLKLKEEVSYERCESNVILSTYKKLWLEMQENVEHFRACAEKAKEQFQSLELLHCEANHLGFKRRDIDDSELISLEYSNDATRNKEQLKKQSLGDNRGLCEIFSDYVTISSDEVLESKSVYKLDLNHSSSDALPISDKLIPGYFDLDRDKECQNVHSNLFPGVDEALSRYSVIQARSEVCSHNGNDTSCCKGGSSDRSEKEVVQHLALFLNRPEFDLNVACGSLPDLEVDASQSVPTSMILNRKADVSNQLAASFIPVSLEQSQVPQDGIIPREVKGKVGGTALSGGHCNTCDEDEIICLRPIDSKSSHCKGADSELVHVLSF